MRPIPVCVKCVGGADGRHVSLPARQPATPFAAVGTMRIQSPPAMMTVTDTRSADKPAPDGVLLDVADYVTGYEIRSELARETSIHCLMDTLACGFDALDYPACTRHVGPVVPGATMAGGARVPGTSFELDPVQAAFCIGTMIRWLDFNDTWLAAEWGHPSDNLGGILAVADWLSRRAIVEGRAPLTMRDVTTAMIKAHEIQGVIALENSFNRVGLDHVLLVRIATTAVVTAMLGGDRDRVIDALSNAWIDGGALRTYRHAPNTGSRKSWAAGDATSRGVRHALMALAGEMGYPTALTAKTWGFYDVLFQGRPFHFSRGFGSYVMENILFKISFPAEFHGQTAVECALRLHPEVRERLGDVDHVVVETQESAVRIIDKTGPLANPADRDHCLQYMAAIALIFGRLKAADYEDGVAADPRIDELREKMLVRENVSFSAAYLDPDTRSIANAVQVFFRDGSATERVQVDFPVGHRRRRSEGIPLLLGKFEASVERRFPRAQAARVKALFRDRERLEALPVNEFVSNLVRT